MAYIDDVPPVWNAWPLYASARDSAADTRLLVVGDSKSYAASTAANYMHGVTRTWNVAQWSFITLRSDYVGSPAWLAQGFQNNSSCTRTIVPPGTAFSGGENDLYPVPVIDRVWSADIADGSASPFSQLALTDCLNYAGGDPWSGVAMVARYAYYTKTGHVGAVRVRSYRNSHVDFSPTYTTVNTSSAVTIATGSGAWSYTDISCGSGAFPPGVGIIEASVNENATRMYFGAPTFYRGTTTTRTTGFGLSALAYGGWNTLDVLRAIGGDGANETCTDANATAYLRDSCFWPNFILIDIGQNVQAAEGTELNAGTQTTYKANVALIMDQFNSLYDAASQPRPFFILKNHTESEYTRTHMETKGRALFSLAQERGCGFIDGIQSMPGNCSTVLSATSCTAAGAGPTYTITKVGAFTAYWPQVVSVVNNGGSVTSGLVRIESKTSDALTVRPITAAFGSGTCNVVQIKPFTVDGVHYNGPDLNSTSLTTGNGAEWTAAADWNAMAGEYRGRLLASAVRARVR